MPQQYIILSLLVLLLLIGVTINAQTQPSESAAMMTRSQLVDETRDRLTQLLSDEGELVLLFQVGGGSDAEAAEHSLSKQLAQHGGIIFSRIESIDDGAVSDISTAGSHVNASHYIFRPYPDLVVSINENQGQVYIAVRHAGTDPLAVLESDWLWVLPDR